MWREQLTLWIMRSVYGAGFRGSWGHFPELKEEKTKVEVEGAEFWYKKPE